MLLDYSFALENKYAYALRASCFYLETSIFEQNIQQKVLVFHSVLLGACPQPCSKRADTILYYYFYDVCCLFYIFVFCI